MFPLNIEIKLLKNNIWVPGLILKLKVNIVLSMINSEKIKFFLKVVYVVHMSSENFW